MGMMPKKINAENKIIGNITFTVIFICIICAISGWLLGALIGSKYRLVYAIAAAVISFVLMTTAPSNRRKNCAAGIADLIKFTLSKKVMYGAGSEEQKDRRYRDQTPKR